MSRQRGRGQRGGGQLRKRGGRDDGAQRGEAHCVEKGSVPRWQGSVVDSGAAEYGGGQFSRCGGMTEQNVAAKRSVAADGAKQPRSAKCGGERGRERQRG